MRTKRGVFATLIAAAAISATVLPAFAEEPPPPILAEPLTSRAEFVDEIAMKIRIKVGGSDSVVVNTDDPSRTVVVRFTVQPGAEFPWHTHLGPVIVNIVSGALTYVGAEDCDARTYSAGEAFIDAGHGHAHRAFNPTGAPTVFIATFFEAPASGALVVPTEPGDC